MESLIQSPCGYFDKKTEEAELYLFPSVEDAENAMFGEGETAQLSAFDYFLAKGFRRNGAYLYREVCSSCRKCVPIRIRVSDYKFSKSERHLLKKNADITVDATWEKSELVSNEKVMLMREYATRHKDSPRSFEETRKLLLNMNGLLGDDGETELEKPIHGGTMNIDYRLSGRLVGVSVIDYGLISMSSNYFYYSVEEAMMKRSLGSFSILKEIEMRWRGVLLCPFYYLGYWISDCRKMSYKSRFKPHELFVDGTWSVVR
ncbi:MAG: hypothetical protein II921_03420 [Treponema sp.]|nr:hypothetical protein [Treponema sp.]